MDIFKEMFNNFQIILTYELFALILSVVSVYISLYTLYKNRKIITVTWGNLRPVSSGQVYIYSNDGRCETYGQGFLLTIDIVNPSPSDIAFFDLRAFDSKTNINTYLLTRKALLPLYKDSKIYCSDEKISFELDIPEKQYGVLKANSFSKFDIFIMPNEYIENSINISFKVATSSWFKRDMFAVTNRKKYKFYGRSYDISGENE